MESEMLPICQVFRTVQLLSMKGSILSFYGSLPALGLFVYGARGRAGLLDSSGTLLRLAPLPTHGLLRDNGLFLRLSSVVSTVSASDISISKGISRFSGNRFSLIDCRISCVER
jgi:hypothetical protein